jgi:hypothetical protein
MIVKKLFKITKKCWDYSISCQLFFYCSPSSSNLMKRKRKRKRIFFFGCISLVYLIFSPAGIASPHFSFLFVCLFIFVYFCFYFSVLFISLGHSSLISILSFSLSLQFSRFTLALRSDIVNFCLFSDDYQTNPEVTVSA